MELFRFLLFHMIIFATILSCGNGKAVINELFVGAASENWQFIELKSLSDQSDNIWRDYILIVADCMNSSVVGYIQIGEDATLERCDEDKQNCGMNPELANYPFYIIGTDYVNNIMPLNKRINKRYPVSRNGIYSTDILWHNENPTKFFPLDKSRGYVILLVYEPDLYGRAIIEEAIAPKDVHELVALTGANAVDIFRRVDDYISYGMAGNCPAFASSPFMGSRELGHQVIRTCGPNFNPLWSINRCSNGQQHQAITGAKYALPTPAEQNDCCYMEETVFFAKPLPSTCFLKNPCNNPRKLPCSEKLEVISEFSKQPLPKSIHSREVIDRADLILSRGDGEFGYTTRPLGELHVCDMHKRQILYEDAKHWKKHGSLQCTFPKINQQNIDHSQAVQAKKDAVTTKSQAQMLLERKHIFVKVGTPLCHKHYQFLRQVQDQKDSEQTAEQDCHYNSATGKTTNVYDGASRNTVQYATDAVPRESTTTPYFTKCGRKSQPPNRYCEESASRQQSQRGSQSSRARQQSRSNPQSREQEQGSYEEYEDPLWPMIKQLIETMGIKQMHPFQQNFGQANRNTIVNRVYAMQRFVKRVCHALTPHGGGEELAELVLRSEGYRGRKIPGQLELLLRRMGDAFQLEHNHVVKIHDLAIVAKIFSFKDLQEFYPNLSPKLYTKARKMAIWFDTNFPSTEKKRRIRERYDRLKVQSFLNYITSYDVVTELPFGCTTITASTGQQFDIPQLLRDQNKSRIIFNYLRYLDQTDQGDLALSASSLYRILKWAKAKTRKCVQGLDYFTFSGNEAIDNIQDVIEKMGKMNSDNSWAKEMQHLFERARTYVKHDYRIHIKEYSRFGDHCSTFALNDVSSTNLRKTCDHDHDMFCDRCDEIQQALIDTQDALKNAEYSDSIDKSNDEWQFQQSREAIENWRRHQVRAVHQERSRTEILENLKENEVYCTIDYAMKFLAIYQQEDQSKWYAKRGICWHVAVCYRKNETDFMQRNYIHVLRHSCMPISAISTAIIHDMCVRLKEEVPRLDTLYLRSDNAGYYHCSQTIATLSQISVATGLHIKRYDFSEPQAGKSCCDRTASLVKNSVRLYVAEGHRATTAEEFVKSAGSYKAGVRHTTFILASVDPVESRAKHEKASIAKVMSYYNFEFDKNDETIRAWRAWNIGAGVLIPKTSWQGFENRERLTPGTIETHHEVWRQDHTQRDVRVYGDRYWELIPKEAKRVPQERTQCTFDKKDAATEKLAEDDGEIRTNFETDAQKRDGLWVCPEPGCMKMFLRHHNYNKHIRIGQHQQMLQSQTLADCAKLGYIEAIKRSGLYVLPSAMQDIIEGKLSGKERNPLLTKPTDGWSFQPKRQYKSLSLKVRNILIDKFNEGITTGRKFRAPELAKEMRRMKDEQGVAAFLSDEVPSDKQIDKFWQMLSKNNRGQLVTVNRLTEERAQRSDDDQREAEMEEDLEGTYVSELVFEPDDPGDFEVDLEAIRNEIENDAHQNLESTTSMHGHRTPMYVVGQLVLIVQRHRGKPRSTSGPYEIDEYLSERNQYKLKDPDTKQKIRRPIDESDLKPYQFTSSEKSQSTTTAKTTGTALLFTIVSRSSVTKLNPTSARTHPTVNPKDLWLTGLTFAQKIEIESGEMLDDSVINAVHLLTSLKNGQHFETSLAFQLGPFQPVKGKNHIQILYQEPEHWVLSILKNERLQLADSSNYGRNHVNPSIVSQLASLYPMAIKQGRSGPYLRIEMLPVQQQGANSDCGVYAVAFAFEESESNGPANVNFDHPRMRQHLIQVLETRTISRFPQSHAKRRSQPVVSLNVNLT